MDGDATNSTVGSGGGDEAARPVSPRPGRRSVVEVFLVALRLGLTSFGGPVAHIGYFREEYVKRRRWLDEPTFADLVAVSQFLPGAGSSKLGMSIGILRAGLPGGIASWLGFTLPSAVLLVLFGYGADYVGDTADGWLHGLKIVAVAVVALAVWSMARRLAPDRIRGAIAIGAALVMLAWDQAGAQVVVILAGGVLGALLFRQDVAVPDLDVQIPLQTRTAVIGWLLFAGLLVGLPIMRQNVDSQAVNMTDGIYRSGALVFGGGHVVLPLLEEEVVHPGWVADEDFLAGYGAAQAVPGPLFTFGAYLGTVMGPEPNGVAGAGLGLVAIFLPSFLLTLGVLPLWGSLRSRPAVQAPLRGVNAAVVGILLAALYDPVFTSSVEDPSDVALALAAFGALTVGKAPPWLAVLLTAVAAGAIAGL